MQEEQESHVPVMLFLSYAQEDEPLRAQLENHLRLLQRQGLISAWHNRLILAGSDHAQETEKHLNMASIILLLISSDFLASDFCYSIEMQRALERAQRNEAYVIPILLRPVDWQNAPFRDLPSLPQQNKAVTTWPNPDEAFREIAAGIRAAAKQIHTAADRHHLPPLSLHTITVIPDQPEITLEEAETAYRRQLVETYKWLNFSGFDRPDLSLANVRLEDVFVRLALTVEKVIREPAPSEQPSQAERRESLHQERVVTVQEPIELGQALSKHLLIVGDPGAGKSTLLRWLAVTFAQARQQEPDRLGLSADSDRLPILVELGRLPDRYLQPEGGESPNWIQFLPEYLSAQMAFTTMPPQLLTQALADGRCLLLFDGLDEVADRQARTRLARSLVELARLSSGNRVIIGSRPAGVSESEGALRPQFRRCQIERFTSEDVQRFFRFWYALDRGLTPAQQHDNADALYARVQATPATLRLASNPLLSTILVLIWRNEGDLPARRVELYKRCCRALIEYWENHHHVSYQGILSKVGWERHLRLLAPLAYSIHSQEQRTNASRTELIPLLAQSLQAEGLCSTESAALLEAEQFLSTLSLRSALLQYLGNDRYGFPHQTFQEYLAARYIAAQPEPEHIDMVMAHLHEAWWQEVHLLTIAHLGSGNMEASKASALILAILRVYAPPGRILRSSRHWWLRLIRPGKLLPQVQLERRIAWILAREFELVAKGYAECLLDGTTAMVGATLSAQAAALVRHIIYDRPRFIYDRPLSEEQEALLTVACQLPQRLGGEAVVNVLLRALHDAYWPVQVVRFLRARKFLSEGTGEFLLEALRDADGDMREQAAKSLGQVGAGNEAVVSALLEALHDRNSDVREQAAKSLGQVGAGNEAVVSALLRMALDDANWGVRRRAAESLEQVGVSNEAVIRALLEAALLDADWEMRGRAAAILGQVGVGNEAVIRALLRMALPDVDWEVRRRAAESLGQVGVGNEAVIRVLLEAALHDADRYMRVRAARVLGQVGVGNEAVMRALLEALLDADWEMRGQAAESLGQVGVSNEAVIRVLLESLHDEYWPVREQAAESLGQVGVGNEAVIRALLQMALHDTDRYMRVCGVEL